MRRMWIEKEVLYLKENLEEKTIVELAQQLKRSPSSVSRKLVELGLRKGRKAKAKDYWTEKQIQTLEDLWDKVSLEELAKKVGRSILATKGKKNFLGLNKRSLVNAEFFNEETPEKYYVLGYIFADGNLYAGTNGCGNPTYSFSLCSVDAEELQRILTKIAPGRLIYLSKTNQVYAFKITNERIYKSLAQYGLHPKKSYTIQFPNIPDRFLGEFLRGYFDGDGWFSYVKSTQRWKLGFTSGSRIFLKQLQARIVAFLDLTSVNTVQKFNLTFSKKQDVFRIANLLYKDMQCDLYLRRKQQSYQQAIAWCKQLGVTE